MSNKDRAAVGVLAYFTFVLSLSAVILYGWFLNFMELLNNSDAMGLGEIVVRGIGVLAVPLGTIMGYFF